MAESFMSQDEINALLSGVEELEEGVNSPESKQEHVEPTEMSEPGSHFYSKKVLKGKEKGNVVFNYNYNSPIIKSKDIAYNSNLKNIDSGDRVPVYTLPMYRNIG